MAHWLYISWQISNKSLYGLWSQRWLIQIGISIGLKVFYSGNALYFTVIYAPCNFSLVCVCAVIYSVWVAHFSAWFLLNIQYNIIHYATELLLLHGSWQLLCSIILSPVWPHSLRGSIECDTLVSRAVLEGWVIFGLMLMCVTIYSRCQSQAFYWWFSAIVNGTT